MKKTLILFILLFIIPFVSSATQIQNLTVTSCGNNTGSNSYNGACGGTYPNATCGTGAGNRLLCDDNVIEVTYSNTDFGLFGGNQVNFSSPTTPTCASITSVTMILKWYSGVTPDGQWIAIANNGSNFTIFNQSVYPDTQDNAPNRRYTITNLKNWTCSGLFSTNRTALRTWFFSDTGGAPTNLDVAAIEVVYDDGTTNPKQDRLDVCNSFTGGLSGFFGKVTTVFVGLITIIIVLIFFIVIMRAINGDPIDLSFIPSNVNSKVIMIGIFGIVILGFLILVVFGILCSI